MYKRCISCAGRRCLPLLINKLKFHSSSGIVLHSSFDKHLPSPNVPTPVQKLFPQDTDILLEEFKKAPTIDRVLELISMHLDVMNSKHVVACFGTVHSILRVQENEHLILTENETFQDLCIRMMKVIRSLEPQEVLIIYKTLSGLKVRCNTFVMQSVLKMLGAHLNNMTLGQLNFLSFLLNKERRNTLVDGLKLALPLVLQVQIDQQIDSNNIREIVDCLRLATHSRLKTSTIEKIVTAILNDVKSLSPEQAVTVIISLLTLQAPVDGFKELVDASFNIITKYPEELNLKALLLLVRLCRNQNFYHYIFFNLVSQRAISEKWDFNKCTELVHLFYHLDVSYPPLLDYLSELLCDNPVDYLNNPKCTPLNLIEYFTNSGYRPSKIEESLNIVCSKKENIAKLAEEQPHLMLKFISCLSILGHFPNEVLSHKVNEEYLLNAWSMSKQYGRSLQFERSILALTWSMEIYEQQQWLRIPPYLLKKIYDSVQQRQLRSDDSLQKCIESGLGGAQFLQSAVYALNGHTIDYVLAMRSGNYPVSLDDRSASSGSTIKYLENLKVPGDAKIIPIIVAGEEQYCRDPEILKGFEEIKIRNLIKKSYTPVVINYKTWTDMPDREKIPYLMREIRRAVDIEKSANISYVHESF